MELLIDSIMALVSVIALGVGGNYTLKHAATWMQKTALTEIDKGLPPLEPSAQIMTGGKLDY